MNIEGKDVGEINQLFRIKSDAGARWVAYQKDKESIGKDDLHFFTSCNHAQEFCDRSSSMYYQYHFTALEKVLDALAENKPQVAHSYIDIYEAWNNHKLQYMFGDANIGVIAKLNRGELIPVSYAKNFIPRDEIGRYHVVELSGYRSSDQSHKIIHLSLNAQKANQFYHDEINVAEKNPLRRLNQFLLIGELKNCSLKLAYGAMPVDNTGLLLSMSSPIADEFGIVKHRDHKTLHDLDETTFLFQSVFARYNEQSRALNFYNDKLVQISDPTKVWSLIDVSNYDDGMAVVIKGANLYEAQRQALNINAPKKNMNGEEKERVKEKQNNANRLKDRL